MLRPLLGLIGCLASGSALTLASGSAPTLAPGSALTLAPLAARARSVAPRFARGQPIVCQAEGPTDVAEKTELEVSEDQIDLVERASDPFRVIRVVLYVTFGIAGLAGCAIAVSQMGKDPGQAMSNLAVNGAVLAGGVGIFIFDKSVTSKLREKAAAELKNPYLKGDAVLKDQEDD